MSELSLLATELKSRLRLLEKLEEELELKLELELWSYTSRAEARELDALAMAVRR